MFRLNLALAFGMAIACASCRDVSAFNTGGDSFQGAVVAGDFVRTGVAEDTNLCLTLDTDHLQDAPGNLSTSDGRFHAAAMRPIPQIWHDPLSTIAFGEGRIKNLVYVVAASQPFDDGDGNDVMTVVSLLASGGVEVRLIRGAPNVALEAGAPSPTNVFAVFSLVRQKGPCSY